jgi:hypothetical protein
MDDQKLIRSTNGPDEVYRFKIDPQESSPVADPDPEFLRRAEEIIAARDRSLVEKPPEQAADKSLIERLRSLGYVQ